MSSWRVGLAWLVCCALAVTGVLIVTASHDGVAPEGGSADSSSLSIASNLLAVPGVQSLDDGEQERDQLLANRANPQAVDARLLSRTRYEHLGADAAATEIRRIAPAVVAQSPSGIGHLPSGVKVSRYLDADAARVDLPTGKHAVVASLTPMATRGPSGGYVPVDLGLHAAGQSFVADNPATPVSIPRSLASGVRLDEPDVSLTPVSVSGTPLSGTGRIEGGAVVYPNTATDADTAAKPISSGMEVYDTLRSTDSPQQLSYRVGMPTGASLVSSGAGASSVVLEGHNIATIPPPSAVDAEGTPVPVSSTVSGQVLSLKVEHRSGDYAYPIVVDPTVIDSHFGAVSNWRFVDGGGSGEEIIKGESFGEMKAKSWVEANEWGALIYPTQGESHIYELSMETSGAMGSAIENHIAIIGKATEGGIEKGVWEGSKTLAKTYGRSVSSTCVGPCASSEGTAGNVAAYWTNAIENANGVSGKVGSDVVYAGSVYIAQTNGPTVAVDTTKEREHEGWGAKNIFHGSGLWLSSGNVAEFDETDPGVGVSAVEYTVAGKKWTYNLYNESQCSGPVQCPLTATTSVWSGSGGGLPNGEPTIEVKSFDATGAGSSVTTAKLRVDTAAPHEITLSGLPESKIINDATQGANAIKLVGHATDGITGTPSSGIASLELAVDGREVGGPNGSCTPGPCTATGEWTIDGEEFAVGEHTLTVTATDVAGNSATSNTTFSVRHAAPVSFGPGELNPVTGEFDLEEEDASAATSGSDLSIVRGYSSREPSMGAEGAFGAPWSLSVGGAQELVRYPNGNMVLVSATGEQTTFTSKGGGKFEAPPGDTNLSLSANGGETEYTLTDKASSTKFKHISGDNETVWRASIAAGTAGTNTTQYTYQSVGGIIEPEEELGPVPAGVSCTPTLNPGCRALTFNYASSTTATGEARSEWGDYTGRLTRVYFVTGEEKEGKIVQVTKTVVQYAYDSKGRLRAEWDPRISPALKTTYGYDAEGHVTVISPPGKESWVFTYGTTATDTRPGRLIKMMTPPPSEALWGGEVLKNTAAPVLSGSPVVKVRMAVSDGTWSGGAISYGYQWEDCNSSGAECKPIGGATNANYTPVASDVGHKLVAQVTATSGGGSVVAATTASAVVQTPVSATTQSVETGSLGAVSCVPGTSDCVVGDSKGNAYYSTNVSTGSAATWTSWAGIEEEVPINALACPTTSLCLISGVEEDEWGYFAYATALGGSWKVAGSYLSGINAVSCASTSMCVAAHNKSGSYRYSTSPASTSWSFEFQGSGVVKSVSCLSSSFCAMGDSVGKLRVATSTAQIESSSWTESSVDGTTALNGLACTSTSSCLAVDTAGNVLNLTIGSGGEASTSKQDIDEAHDLTALSCSGTSCVAVDNQGNIFGSTDSGKTWLQQYGLKDNLTSVSCASSKLCMTVDTTGHDFAFDPTASPVSQGEARSPQPGTTVEYNVPVSGTGAPYSLSSGEVSKWAQTDVPVEATAIFPADESAGWPAPDYRRATVDYLDINDRVVNVASPGGAIVTSEYNSHNDVVRNLSADNRAVALKEGSKSAEVSQTLDTQSTYNSEGTELLSTLGPLHTVKLANGTTVKARAHTVYSYDEGSPETGGPYRLVTKVTEGAQISGEAEADVRTTKKSYAGQGNLGWALRKPTATIVDPSGLDLIHSTVYDPASGNVTETRSPGAGAADESVTGYAYSSTFGSPGSGNGHVEEAEGIARDAEGNLWVADTGNDRIEEFSSGGTFIQKFGGPGTSEGQLERPTGIAIDKSGNIWVTDTGKGWVDGFTKTGTNFRTLGVGGLLKEPMGIAYSNYNGRLYVADTADARVVELNPENSGEWTIIGKKGTGHGEFSYPEGVAVDSSGNIFVTDVSKRVQKLSATGTYISELEAGHLKRPVGIAVDSKGNILVSDATGPDVQVYSSSGAYQYQFGEYGSGSGQMWEPTGMVLDNSDNLFMLDTGNDRVQQWLTLASDHRTRGNGGTHGMQTVYYTTGINSEVSACGTHPEWAGLPCEKRPAAQPETSGVPNLPVTTITYNIWDEPLVSTESVGSTTRTNTNVYDEAGRVTKDTVSSSVGTVLPSVEYEYNSETGDAIKSKTTVEGTTRTLESVYDKRGELTSYKDADGNTASFYYDPYGRLESLNDGKGTQTYTYDTTTGLPSKLVDSAAGTFTGTYDVEGNLTSAGYPNGMSVNHTYDSTGSETGVEYVKTTHCSSGCTWYSQSESPSIHGQTLSQSSTLSSQAYTYDAAGRLTKAQDTPAGEGCTTRIYAYDQETNIDSLTTRPPGTGGVCASEGGTAVNHTYDTANRLTDAGIGYDSFGDITKLPAGDAGGSEVTGTFYVDETLASQVQKGQTLGYYLDPEGRDRQIVSTGTVNSTVTYHYAGDGSAPAWTEDTAGKWTRNIYGLEGLVATQNGGESPVLQVQDLKGDIVGTASLSETATGLLSKGDSTEYGVPRTSSPPKYSWQGASALRTELSSGIVAMGARSYVPEIGRFLQPDPIEGGSANEYAYTYGDPVNSSDPSGEYTVATPSWVSGFFDEQAEIATEAAIQRAAEEQAAREEAEEKAMEAAEEAAEAAESAAEAQAGGGKKGKGKAAKSAKAAKAKADLAMSSKVKSCTGPGPYKCAKPGAGTKGNGKGKKESPRNKKCEDGEVKVGEHCEKGPGKKQRPDPPIPPPTIIEEVGKDAEGAVDDCIELGLCE